MPIKNFNFYFRIKKDKKISLNEEKNLLEIDLDDWRQGILFSQQEFQGTMFQTLTLPATSLARKVLAIDDIAEKEIVIKDIQHEPTFSNLNEKTLKLIDNTFGAVEMVNSENENPFQPIKISWDDFWNDFNGKPEKKGKKSWRMWWNPRNMKFWDPPLTPEEQAKYLASKMDDRYKAWEIHKERLNKQGRKIDLYFQVNNTDKSHSVSGSWCNEYRDRWTITCFSWPPFVPPSEIKELIPNDSSRIEEMNELVIGRIDLFFDNQDAKNMELFHQWDNLLAQASPNQKFVIRNIPLQIQESFYSLDNFSDFHKLDWQNWHKKGDEEPQWEKSTSADFMSKAIYRGKKVKAIKIGTKGLEKQLKLEKTSEKQYNNNLSEEEKNNNSFDWTPWIIGGGMFISALFLAIILFRRNRKTSK